MNTIDSIYDLIDERNAEKVNRELSGVWNKVWDNSKPGNYSKLRIFKNIDKVLNLQKLGVDFQNKKVLDIGCGDGSLLRFLSEKYYCESYGVDISRNVIDGANSKISKGVKFMVGDHRDLSIFHNNTFDIVISLGVIEHFPEYSLALSEARRVLKQGGKLVLIQPHLLSFGVLQRYWLEFFGNWKFGLQFDFSWKYYEKLLNTLGFQNVIIDTRPPYKDMRLTRMLDSLAKKVYPLWGHYLYLIAEKQDDYYRDTK